MMKSSIFSSFISFVKGSAQYVFFTSLLYSIWLVYSLVSNQRFELESFPQRMIGTATLDAYDVGLRVTLFYKSILVFLFSFTLFHLIAFLLHKKNTQLLTSNEAKLINYSSLIGIILFLFRIFDYSVFYSMELVYFIHKLMFLALFLRFMFFRKSQPTLQVYTFIVLLSLTLYFFLADCFNICGSINNPDFFMITFVISSLLLIGVLFLSKKLTPRAEQELITKLAFILVPLNFLPLISVAKDELYFIFKNNNIILSDATYIFFSLVLLMLISLYYRSKKFLKRSNLIQSKLISLRYLPLFIFSIVSYVHYNHYFYYNDEAFESGNKYLPIMEFKLFGVIPTLEKFNSHLLSDYFFNAIYTFLNGMGGINEIELYDFMYIPFSFTLFYLLVYFITRNPYIAVFTILLFPFYASMLPGGYSFSILGIFALNRIFSREQNLKNYVILFLSIVGIVLWRFDLGYSCMIIIPVILLTYYFIHPSFKIKWIVLFKALLIVLGSLVLLLAMLSLYRNVNLFYKSLYILNYFTSAQTYGYTTIGWENMPSYKMHYFIFPILVTIIILALIVNFRSLNISKKQRLAYLSLFFICCYYIVNYNRGLIRHSLIEWTDEFTATFLYIILPGSIFVFFHRKSTVLKFILFTLISFYCILSYKLPVTTGSISLSELAIKKIQNLPNETLSKINNRIKGLPPASQNRDKDLLNFIGHNIKGQETFIDFTGSSLLYFYTKKITPSFFYQNPLCSHNEFLQKRFIEDLKNYQTPYLLFSSISENDYDMVDGVPNTLRNYRMAEYFYQNFEPHLILGHLRVWKKRGYKDLSKTDTVFRYTLKKDTATSNKEIKSLLHFRKDKKYLLRIEMNAETIGNIKLLYKRETILPILYKANHALYYAILDAKEQNATLLINNYSNSCKSVSVLECDYLPDFYSEKFLSYNFRKLPYIWGSFDKEVYQEDRIFEKNINNIVKKDFPFTLTIPEKIDKSSGNTLILTCKNASKKNQTLTLSFGNKSQKDRSRISFSVLPSAKEENYAIRVSSVYKWSISDINEIEISTETDESISLIKIYITKGL